MVFFFFLFQDRSFFLSLAAIRSSIWCFDNSISYRFIIYLFFKNSFPIDIFRSRRADAWEFLLWKEKVWRRCHTLFKSIVNGGRVCVGSNKRYEKKSSSVSWIVNACCTMRSHEFAVCWIDQPGRERKSFSCVKRSRYFCRVLYYIQYPVWYPIPWTPSSQVQVAILCWFIVNLSGHISNKRKELLTIDIYAICRNLISNFRGVFPRKTHTPKRWWRFD
jgi:hypothetical protein